MQRMSDKRCPYCGIVVAREDGKPVLPGMLFVCAGCAGPSRFSDDHERLVPLGVGELGAEVRDAVYVEQERIRAAFDRYGRPPGHAWRTVAICGSCYEAFDPERKPVVAHGVPASPCAFCGQSTSSGIFRRLLRPLES